jgi:phosphohistidine phosphatase
MKTLHLLRHGKSSWDDPSLTDAERPLAPRGRHAVKAMRRHLADAGVSADLVLVSPARRAAETWTGVAPALPDAVMRVEPSIYGADVAALLTLVHAVEDEYGSVLLIGHDPGFHELAVALSGAGDDHVLTALHTKFPTGSLASITFDGEWPDVDRGRGRLVSFVRPRDLDD